MVAIGAEEWGYEVKIYKQEQSASGSGYWRLFGNPISVSPYNRRRNLALSSFAYPGCYVSLAGNGESIAIGTIEGSATSATLSDYDSADLHVDLYKWIGEEWSSVGCRISRTSHVYGSSRSSWPLQSIKLSQDATVLAIGSFRAVDILSWDDSSLDWISRGVDLNFTDSVGPVG